jgi:hypothetical protein
MIGDIVANLGLNATGFIGGLRTAISWAKSFGAGIQKYGTNAVGGLITTMYALSKLGITVFGTLGKTSMTAFSMVTKAGTRAFSALRSSGASLGGMLKSTYMSIRNIGNSALGLPGKFAGMMGVTGGIVALAGALGAVFAVGTALNGARDDLKEQRTLVAQIAATGGSSRMTQDSVNTLADDMQMKTNFDGGDVVTASSSLMKFRNVQGDTFKDAIKLSADLAASMGTDLGPQVDFLGKALNDPIKGMKALRGVGVVLSDAQKDQVAQLIGAGDIAGAQKILLDQIKERVGGTAEAVADPMIILEHKIMQVSELFGNVLLPSVNIIAAALTAAIDPVSQNTEMAQEWGAALAGLVQQYVVPLIQWLGAGLEYGMQFHGVILNWAVAAGTFLLSYIMPMAQWILGAIVAAMEFGDTLGFAVRNGAALAQVGLIEVAKYLISLIPYGNEIATALVSALVSAWAAIKAGAMSMFEWVKGGFQELLQLGQALLSGIKGMWDAIWNGDNPVEAARKGFDKFADTLAKQPDIKVGIDPYTAMKDSYTQTKSALDAQFNQDDGVLGTLQKKQDALLDGIGKKEVEYEATLKLPTLNAPELQGIDPLQMKPIKAPLIPDSTYNAADSLKKQEKDSEKETANKALLLNSSEGANQVLRALSGAGEKQTEKQTGLLEEIKESTQQSAETNKALLDKLEDGDLVFAEMED